MSIAAIRIFLFTLLPLLMAGGLVAFAGATRGRQRRLEVFLLFLLGLGVAGSGIGGFFAHVFVSDVVAESIGWLATPSSLRWASPTWRWASSASWPPTAAMASARRLSSLQRSSASARPSST